MNFIKYLENIKKRPGMYMADGIQLHDLELQFSGYEAALQNNNVTRDVSNFNVAFSEYIYRTRKWSASRGWAEAITVNAENPALAVEVFFELADEYLNKNYNMRLS